VAVLSTTDTGSSFVTGRNVPHYPELPSLCLGRWPLPHPSLGFLRQQDLDSALLSRFDVAIHFPLPSTIERAAIFGRYARQLPQDSLERLATASGGLSGRNILDVCKSTERRWACKTIRDSTLSRSLPPEEEYTIAIEARQHFAAAARGETARGDAEA